MNKLLSAGFARLWKNKPFWLGMIFFPGIVLLNLFTNYHDMKLGYFQSSLDPFLYAVFILIGVFTAVWAALFLGTEYSSSPLSMSTGATASCSSSSSVALKASTS